MTTKEEKKFSEIFNGFLKEKDLNANRLADLSGVPVRFVEQLLNENYDRLPPAPYIRGYLFKTAEVLSADGEELWSAFQKENEGLQKSGQGDELPKNRFEIKKFNRGAVLAGAAFLLLAIYLAFRADDFLGRPHLYLATPAIDAAVSEPSIELRGQIDSRDTLKINGEDVYVDESGNFQKNFSLQAGLNNIEFKVKRFLGRETLVNRRVIYNPPLENAKR